LLELINLTEDALQTAVQATVKREDEQEFARKNAENLMFCEDAARRIRNKIQTKKSIVDYRIEAQHMESLHPHNAVSIVTGNKNNGFKA
jgi:GTP cyclohydrolase I